MKQPLEVRFLGLEPSPAVEAAARAKAAKLDQFRGDLMSCRVTIELAHKHKHQGQPFAVRIDATMSGRELCVDRVQHEDVYVALRDAFDDMKRQIEESAQRARGEEKLHAQELHGEVVRVSDADRCGFIRTADGDEYWFGPDNVAGTPWEHVQIGAEVRFIPELAAQGRQAKRVSVSRR
ncbi:MAG TPA: HPF/RaiA family ribosome-associated protein [Burkholderiaceae bacterium]|nr:HPF/RaiA family ribosome-associated protein [Burkholderiaceae bacterium]